MIRKLRQKFVFTNMLIVLILLSVLLGMVMVSTKARMEKDDILMLRRAVSGPIAPVRPNESDRGANLPFFRLTLSRDGELLRCEGAFYDLSDEAVLQELIHAVSEREDETGVLKEYRLRYLRRELSSEQVIAFSDISSEQLAIQHLFKNCILIGLAGLALFFLVSVLLSRWAVRPVEQAWQQQKQFVADASHELKTPLTVILTSTELLQSDSCSPEERKSFLDSIRSMGQQMRGLTEELLILARADQPDGNREMGKVNWSKAVCDAVLPFEPVFFEKGLSVETDIEEKIQIKGNAEQLRQVTEILLDNAQKYCEPDTATELSLRRQGRNALLAVVSRGEEIPKEELDRIFQRFYRTDRVRSMNHSYGLGLAIAKQITENHRGRIWAESSEGKNSFFVRIPCI